MKLIQITLSLCIALSADLLALKVEITQGQTTPDPIAVSFLNSLKTLTKESPPRDMSDAITSVIENDLKMSGYFDPIDHNSFIQSAEQLNSNKGPNLKEWSVLKVRFLLYGNITLNDNKLEVQFHLVDIITGKKMLNLSMKSEATKWRKLAHMVSDAIFSRITDSKGMFNTRVAYVESLAASLEHPKRRIMIMDLDGYGAHAVTPGKTLVMMPSFSPNGRYVAYLKFPNKRDALVELLDLSTKTSRPLLTNIARDALNFSPNFSPDSTSMVFSLTGKGGASAICYKKLTSNNYTALTPYIGINTSPCFSPDGKRIVFTSNGEAFGGRCKENIFIMDSDGKNVRRISNSEGKYSQPVWSPRGDLIAFTKQIRSDFYIGVMNSDGTNERLIAHGYLVESPSWSPNGRYIIYARQDNSTQKGQIWMVEITGRVNMPLDVKGDASDSAWSPLLTGLKIVD